MPNYGSKGGALKGTTKSSYGSAFSKGSGALLSNKAKRQRTNDLLKGPKTSTANDSISNKYEAHVDARFGGAETGRIIDVEDALEIPEPEDDMSGMSTEEMLQQIEQANAAERESQRRIREEQILAAEQEAIQAEDAEIARLSSRPRMRDRILLAIAAGMQSYANDGGPSQILADFNAQQEMKQERLAAIMSARQSRAREEAEQLRDQQFRAGELDFDAQSDRNRQIRDINADDARQRRGFEHDEGMARLSADLREAEALKDHERRLGLMDREAVQQRELLYVQSGLNRQEASHRAQQEVTANYTRYLTEDLGLSPEDADNYLRGRVSGDWSQTDPEVRSAVTNAIARRAAVQESDQEIARLQARRGITAPVFDQAGNVVMTGRRGDTRPMEVPLGPNDPLNTRYVQGADGSVRADERGAVDPMEQAIDEILEQTGGDLTQVDAAIDADEGLDPAQRQVLKLLARRRANRAG